MLQSEVFKKYPNIIKDGITFTLRYRCSDIIPIYDEENVVKDYELVDFELVNTPDEMAELNTTEPHQSQMEVLETRVDGLENINAGLLLENAEQQIKIQEQEKMNKEQEVTNANLLLEIAMLKGAML